MGASEEVMVIEAMLVREAKSPVPLANAPLQASGKSNPAVGKSLPPVTTPVEMDLHQAAALIDQFLRNAGRELSFSVDDSTGIVVVSVRDPHSGELIRQMPSAEALRIASNLAEHGPSLVDEFV
jgi:flagellar protein FlaG